MKSIRSLVGALTAAAIMLGLLVGVLGKFTAFETMTTSLLMALVVMAEGLVVVTYERRK